MEKPQGSSSSKEDSGLWRDVLGFGLLALCNNYGNYVMLVAALDIVHLIAGDSTMVKKASNNDESSRGCGPISTGIILITDIIPRLIVTLILPFFPFWIDFYIGMAIFLSACGFLLVAFATTKFFILLGIVSTAISLGLGETSFLAYTAYFNKNVISSWSSGTGAAGIVGSTSYTVLREFNVSPRTTMLIMLVVPVTEIGLFWGLLRRPQMSHSDKNDTAKKLKDSEKPFEGFKNKLLYIKFLLKYMIPVGILYFFMYWNNQGLFELIYFENFSIDRHSQYRYFVTIYQTGIFISRSSVNIVQINKIWLLAIFQFINFVYILTEALYFYTPTIWIVFTVVLWEGLIGGSAYVNTFYKMSKEIAAERRKFSMGMVVISKNVGTLIAGFMAIPTHNIICEMPQPHRR